MLEYSNKQRNYLRLREDGNVLFMILVAIALFAALSYAVTSSSRGSGSSISKDKARTNAAAIIQYTSSLRSAVMRMKISNGCTDDTINFSTVGYQKNNGTLLNTVNANAPLKCYLFSPDGGNMPPVVLPFDAQDTSIAIVAGNGKLGHGTVRVQQFTGIGTDGPAGTVSANDIYIAFNYINRDTCLAINDLLNIDNPGGEPPTGAGSTGSSGTYTCLL